MPYYIQDVVKRWKTLDWESNRSVFGLCYQLTEELRQISGLWASVFSPVNGEAGLHDFSAPLAPAAYEFIPWGAGGMGVFFSPTNKSNSYMKT